MTEWKENGKCYVILDGKGANYYDDPTPLFLTDGFTWDYYVQMRAVITGEAAGASSVM